MASELETKDDIFSRVEQLAENDPDAQDVIRSAELDFLALAAKANWPDWDGGEDPEAMPPQWEAALAYIKAVCPAYAGCCARLSRRPADLDRHLDLCIRRLALQVFDQKVLTYTHACHWTSERAARRFEQVSRNTVARILTELRTNAWKANSCLPAVVAARECRRSGNGTAGAVRESQFPLRHYDSEPPADNPQTKNTGIRPQRRPIARSVGTPEAVGAVSDFIEATALTLTQFGNQFQTTERTVRRFLQNGKMRRANFEAMATSMGITAAQLLSGQLPASIARPNRR